MSISINISYGELLDKLTILEIKSERIQDPAKLDNINKEMSELSATWLQEAAQLDTDVDTEVQQLKAVNEKLWEIEDAIRDKEKHGRFDKEFIELARAVYLTNDKRAAIKKEINSKLRSGLIEEKSYADYSTDE